MESIEYFIADYEGEQQEILYYLHDFMLRFPGVTTKIRYRVPFYYRHSWFCYLNPRPKGQVELSFIQGHKLSNVQGLLVARDRKMVRSLIFEKMGDISEESLLEIVQEALLIDEEIAAQKAKRKG